MVNEEYWQFCIITNEHSVCCDVRLHCFLIVEEIVIMGHETSDSFFSEVGH